MSVFTLNVFLVMCNVVYTQIILKRRVQWGRESEMLDTKNCEGQA